MTDRRTMTIYVRIWDDSFEVPVHEFIQEVESLISTVPDQFHKDLILEFDRYGDDYDTSRGEMSLRYTRPETDAEYQERKRQAAWSVKDQEDRERRQLAALKAKYESR